MSSCSQNTLSSDLMARLGQKDKPDLYLVGSDGVEVPACRWILASRSDVLDGMLCGKFKEAASEQVKLDFSSEVLKTVVEFSVTDSIQSLEGCDDEAAARCLVQLVACAHFLNLPLLEDKAQAFLNDMVDTWQGWHLACAVFEEASLSGATESVKLDALTLIRKLPRHCLLSSPGVSVLGSAALTEIISDKEMDCEEITLFRALNLWATEENGGDTACSNLSEDRASIAKSLATSHIQFLSVQPSDLVDEVKNSGLVDKEVVFEALQAHALLAEKELEDGHFSKTRKTSRRPQINISGAGTRVVNGDYELNGEYKDYPKFTKKSLWRGEERTFAMYTNGEVWYIGLVEKDGSIGETRNEFYYGLIQAAVPSGWNRSCLGKDPCPTCETC